jgi:hypothetical protein
MIGAAPSPALSTTTASGFDYPAPDGSADVLIERPDAQSCEIVIQYSEHSKPIATLSFVSGDREHGSCLGDAGWTDDSRFFVFSIASSGGHQAWHTPIMIYFRDKRLTKPLENFLGNPMTEGIVDPHFVLSSDKIEFTTKRLGPTFDKEEPNHRSIDLQALQP